MSNTNPALTCIYVSFETSKPNNCFNWYVVSLSFSLPIVKYMGTVLAVIYAADTIVAYKYYRDSGDWWLLVYTKDDYDCVIVRLI